VRAAILLCLAFAGCGDGSAEVFMETCVPGPGGSTSIFGGFASHDFGTTDPEVLSRVSAIVHSGLHGPNGQPSTSENPGIVFDGSVAVVSCTAGDAVAFILGAP
jgi:hypothetical protein